VTFSGDGTLIVTADDTGVHTWNSETGGPIDSIPSLSLVDQICLCNAGQIAGGRFASEGEVWDVGGQWTLERTIGGDSESSPFADRVTALDFSPDGRVLAAGGGQPSRGGEVVLLRAGDGSLQRRLDDLHSDAVLSLRFSPDGKQLASGSADRLVKICDPASGKVLHTLEGHGSHVLSVAWSRDGGALASAGADNTIRFWDLASGAAIATTAFDKEITSLCFLGSTDRVEAAGGDARLRIFTTAGKEMRSLGGATDFIRCAHPNC
jgi:WD40 repeat protein